MPFDVDAWIAREKDDTQRSLSQRDLPPLSKWDLDRDFDSHVGSSLKAALEHVEREGDADIRFIAAANAASMIEAARNGVVVGLEGPGLSIRGVIVVTERRFLAIDQRESAAKRGEPPLYFERAMTRLSQYRRSADQYGSARFDLRFGPQEAAVDMMGPEDADRLGEILRREMGG